MGSSNSNSDAFRFRGGDVKAAADLLNDMRTGGVNKSELAREGLKSILQDVTTWEEKQEIYTRFQRGEIREEIVRIFLGSDFETMRADAAEMRDALDDDVDNLTR
jgi:hypothetical protein